MSDKDKQDLKPYKEWREIMKQDYSERDRIIFMAGYTFSNIDRAQQPTGSVLAVKDIVEMPEKDWKSEEFSCPKQIDIGNKKIRGRLNVEKVADIFCKYCA